MDKAQAALFIDVIETAGYEVSSYSGRGMFGRSCVSTDPGSSLGHFVSDVVEALKQCSLNDSDPDHPKRDEFEAVIDGFRSMRTDNMGHDIVVYFTDVPFIDRDADEEEEGDDEAEEGRAHQPECEDGP